MADNFISGLTEVTTPLESDVLPIVSDGETKKIAAKNLRSAIPVATTAEKGLMSASDKQSLTQALLDVAELQGRPNTATIASASTISIPDGISIIILTGTTSITSVLGGLDYHTYTFVYPTGAGVNLLGLSMAAGDVLVAVYKP